MYKICCCFLPILRYEITVKILYVSNLKLSVCSSGLDVQMFISFLPYLRLIISSLHEAGRYTMLKSQAFIRLIIPDWGVGRECERDMIQESGYIAFSMLAKLSMPHRVIFRCLKVHKRKIHSRRTHRSSCTSVIWMSYIWVCSTKQFKSTDSDKLLLCRLS